MTREEAIQVLTDIKRIRSDEIAKAIDMAIEALTVYDKLTCKTCADKTLCIMSAPDGNWKACKDYRPLADDIQANPTIPMFKESAEAYKAWTGEEIGSRSEQYKKGFEDAKRAFEIEYAREAESMLKKNAGLNVLVNAQRELLADRPHGEWIPCSERLPSESGDYLCTIPLDADETYTEVLTFHKGRFYEDDSEWGATYHDDVLAWMPLPTPYKGGDTK